MNHREKAEQSFRLPPQHGQLTALREKIAYLWRLLLPRARYPLAGGRGSLSCRPLFIMGAPRSGTTLLRSMLVAGGEAAIPPEAQVIGKAARKFRALHFLGWPDLCRLTLAQFEGSGQFDLWELNLAPLHRTVLEIPSGERSYARLVDEVFRFYSQTHFPDAHFWGDQSPIHTLYLPWIAAAFPQARYLHLLRDGRDAIASAVEKGRTVQYATERWLASVHRAADLGRRLPGEQFLELRYEQLVSEPEGSLRRVTDFLQISYRPVMLDYWRRPTTVEHRRFPSHRGLQRPVFTDSIGRWQERLTTEQQRYVSEKIAPELRRFGYLPGYLS